MPHLLYNATDRDGKAVQGFVESASAHEARAKLEAQGLVQVVFHQEATIATDASEVAGLDPAQLRELARLRIAAMQRPGLVPALVEVARAGKLWLAVDLGMVVWGVWSGSRSWIVAGVVLGLLPFVIATWQYRHGGRYNALLKSFSLGEWERVRELAAKLRAVGAKTPHLDFDLDVRLAGIEAREGRLEEALQSVEGWRAKLAGTPGLFESRVAALHAAGEDRAGYVRVMAEAYELSGREPARALDFALAHARFGDAAQAGRLLEAIDVSLLPPHAAGFVAWVDGLVRLREQQPGGLDRLSEGLASFLRLANQPAAWTPLAFCTCDHAVALSLAGRKDEARRELQQVWPIVRAHADRALLRMLQADGLVPQQKS